MAVPQRLTTSVKKCLWVVPPHALRSPPPRSAHVWRANLCDSRIARLIASHLTPEERNSVKRHNSQLSRVLLRDVLARYLQESPARIALQRDANGKPFVQNGPCFNATHTDRAFLVAVSSHAVGLDIELRARSLTNLPRLLRRLAPAEAAAVAASDDARAEFLRTWTRKEAFLKCTGEGIRRGLASFSVSGGDGDGDGDGDGNWHVHDSADDVTAGRFYGMDIPLDDHFGSLVSARKLSAVSLYDWQPR